MCFYIKIYLMCPVISGANLLHFYIISHVKLVVSRTDVTKGPCYCWCSYSRPIRIGLFYQQDVWDIFPHFLALTRCMRQESDVKC